MAISLPSYEPRSSPEQSVPEALGLDLAASGELIAAVKRGLPARTFSILAEMLGVSEAYLAGVTGISPSTLMRRKRAGRLTTEESEHLLRIARLLDLATATFGSVEGASEWLRTGNVSLGGATPLDFADTEIGAREVEQLLGRIEYGVYS